MAEKSTAKSVQLENRTRDRIYIPVQAGGNADDGKLLVLGDKLDTDDRVPQGHERNTALQPAPVVTLKGSDYEGLGAFAHGILDDQIAQKRIRKTELAA